MRHICFKTKNVVILFHEPACLSNIFFVFSHSFPKKKKTQTYKKQNKKNPKQQQNITKKKKPQLTSKNTKQHKKDIKTAFPP